MAQNVTVAGASYPDVPSVQLPKTGGGTASFVDISDTTATAPDVRLGKTFYLANGTGTTGSGQSVITGSYNSSTKNLTVDTSMVQATWFGGVEVEFLYEARCTLKLTDAENWPLTPSTTAQSCTWKTSYTTTANANATFDRYGSGYHSGTALDYGTYNYIWLCSGMVHLAYNVDEATMGEYHVLANAFEGVYCYGARPRVASGAIVYPSTTTYGSYGNTSSVTLMTYYRTNANVIALANNATYGVSLAGIAPQQSSTSSRTPAYVNFRYPTIGIRANDSYMPVSAYSNVDWTNTKVEYRARLYRVPVSTGLYTMQNDRIVRSMILGNTFPVEPV